MRIVSSGRLRRIATAAALAVAAACATAANAADPPPTPDYDVDACCRLCPRAGDAASYSSSKYLEDFSVLFEGRDGWLFRSKMDLTTTFDITDDSLGELRRLVTALRRRNTELVIVFQPPRGLMDPQRIAANWRAQYDFDAARRQYAAALQKLRSTGAIVPPLDRLADPDKNYDYFFRRDHHWSPDGAEHTAKLVAEAVRALPQFAGVPQKTFSTHTSGILAKPGTLQKVAAQICGGGYSMQYVPAYVTDAGGGALLGDEAAPQIALVGTSNSDAKGGYNFAGFLQQYLGTDVLDVAISGGSFEGSLLHYLPSAEFQKNPPKILIWEMPYQNYPGSDKNPHKIFRQAVPLVNDGCHGRGAVLSKTMALHAGSNEVLFNGGGRVLPLTAREYQFDIQYDDRTVKDMSTVIWYVDGRRETLKLHFNQYVDNGGRFVAELRDDDPEHGAETMLGLTVEMDQEPAKPVNITAQLCARSDASPTAVALSAIP
ncbi:MAG: hypothetical protein JWR16_1035 [Nevskia sp.]|nr:hypothetical protein [Nevskia sp.]